MFFHRSLPAGLLSAEILRKSAARRAARRQGGSGKRIRGALSLVAPGGKKSEAGRVD